jgi:ATP-dependent Lon protease
MSARFKSPRPFRELPAAKLRWHCDPKTLGFRDTTSVEASPEIIGQPRALEALRLGLEIDSPGFNIFVVGLTGTGKTTTISRLFEELRVVGEVPDDLCYVHNFRRADEPTAIQLPAGTGRVFRNDMSELVDYIRQGLPEIYESDEYQTRHRKTVEIFKERGRAVFKEFEAQVEAENFRIVQIQMGPMTSAELHPILAGEPVPIEKLRDLAEEGRFEKDELDRLQSSYTTLSVGLQNALKEGRRIQKSMRDSLRKLDRYFCALVIREPIRELKEKFEDVEGVGEYLDAVEDNILDSLSRFVRPREDASTDEDGASSVQDPEMRDYEVNLVVDHSRAKGPPVVLESSPTFRNLFGSVDYEPTRGGMWRTDFTKITAGSLLVANGGFLVFNLNDVHEPGVWPTLKRALKNRRAEIRGLQAVLGVGVSPLKPEPVSLNVKVVIVGDSYSYHMLHAYDDEFRKIFKVKADFDSSMARTRRSVRQYAGFVAQVARTEQLSAFDASGVAAVIEVGARLAGRQDRLSTRFSDIADVVREADYWAGKEQKRFVQAKHVDRAMRQRAQRVNLAEERVQRSIDQGMLLLDVRGGKIGQVNGLTVYDLGDYAFGRPARITSEVSMGRSGIINIEREANLSGATHDKGVLILAGYLRGKYAQHRPLTLSASIAFEQSYGGVDGDSASAAELIALISAIARLPLRQDLAVTGSINQKGEMQPIGGINEKIEGFFETCASRGLTGAQGVVFPTQNAPELMLHKDVVDAVRAGKFHLYAVRAVDQGLELLTGIKAGRRTRYGYERDTVHGLVDDALAELAEEIKQFVESSDTASGRGPAQGLADDEEDEGEELRRRHRMKRRGARRAPTMGGVVRRSRRGRA